MLTYLMTTFYALYAELRALLFLMRFLRNERLFYICVYWNFDGKPCGQWRISWFWLFSCSSVVHQLVFSWGL